MQRNSIWPLWICRGLLVGLGCLFSLPFFWMVSTSLKPLRETMKMPPVWLPLPPQWQNYPDAMAAMGPFWLYTANSFFLASLNVLGTVLSSALVAYGFSRLNWKGRDGLF
ncbi:MAG: carbohydrate ABC transporter permease, partial [Verrucomicrobia bacterium]|nr:carbohydrate ABC transporter permease [Verrucomicrobiota bacterium]